MNFTIRPMITLQVIGTCLALLCAGILVACGTPTPLPKPTPPPLASELVLYGWEDDLPQSVLDAFTREFGVKVNYEFYDSQEIAIENLRAGKVYDVATIETRFIPSLVQEKLLAEIDYANVPNFKNIAANFRDLVYDPQNKHSIPYNWGTTGLVVRNDLVKQPVVSWRDLWDPRYAGKTAIWRSQPREVIALTLKSLGYSANSVKPSELDATLKKLFELKPHLLFLEDYNMVTSADVIASGTAVISMGYARDVLEAREKNSAVGYILPKEGALLWGDAFTIPANSPHKYTAEVFLNFMQRPEINAEIANQNQYATPNEAAYPFIAPKILNDPVIFPKAADVKHAEIILPLSPAEQKQYNELWARFLAAK